LTGSIVDAGHPTPLSLALIVRVLAMLIVFASIVRAGQSKGIDFVISRSPDIPVTGSPKDQCVNGKSLWKRIELLNTLNVRTRKANFAWRAVILRRTNYH